jgi:hypothetical protein
VKSRAETQAGSAADATTGPQPTGFPLAEAIWRRYGSAPGVLRLAAAAGPVYRLGGAAIGAWLQSEEVRARLEGATASYASAPALIWPGGQASDTAPSRVAPGLPASGETAAPGRGGALPVVQPSRLPTDGTLAAPAAPASASSEPAAARTPIARASAPAGRPAAADANAAAPPAARSAPESLSGSAPRGLGRGMLRRITEKSPSQERPSAPDVAPRAASVRVSRIEENSAGGANPQSGRDAGTPASLQGAGGKIPMSGVEPSASLAAPPAQAALPVRRAIAGTAADHAASNAAAPEAARSNDFSRSANHGATEVATTNPMALSAVSPIRRVAAADGHVGRVSNPSYRPISGAAETQRRNAATPQSVTLGRLDTLDADRYAGSEAQGADVAPSTLVRVRPISNEAGQVGDLSNAPVFRAAANLTSPPRLEPVRKSDARAPTPATEFSDSYLSQEPGRVSRLPARGSQSASVRTEGQTGRLTVFESPAIQASMRPLQRSAAAEAAEAAGMPGAASTAGLPAGPERPAAEGAPAELSPAELERLADAVYAIIERRLIAERENLGL